MRAPAPQAPAGALHAALALALEAQGRRALDPELQPGADLLELALRVLGRGVLTQPNLDEVLRGPGGLDDVGAAALLELARSPRFGHGVQPEERWVFGARFGEPAADQLAALQGQDLDLEVEGARWSAARKLRLLDGLFALARTPRGIPSAQARALDELARRLGLDGVITAQLYAAHDSRHGMGALSWRLVSERITVGSGPGMEVVLPDPTVARHHCTLLRSSGGWRVEEAGSGRPLLVDGQAVAAAPLVEGQELRVGPWRLSLKGDRLWAQAERSFEALAVQGLSRSVGGRTLLDHVDFVVYPGELVALVGPSGAGKTSLIHAIAGSAPVDAGEVRLGDRPLGELLDQEPSVVGLVPQDDLLHGSLTVAECLRSAGRLRTAGRLSEAQVEAELGRVLEELGIAPIAGQRVGDALHRGISGGQRKRVNLGQELMTRGTRVLFLDEPTAGLDPRSAQEIVRQIRLLADRGRVVFLVTHDLSPVVMAQVDHLLLLVPGGQVAWFGPPERALRAFEVGTADQIFERLAERSPGDWAARWRASPACRDLVQARLAVGALPSLQAWRGRAPAAREPAPGGAARRSAWVQLQVLCGRYARTRLRDRAGLAVLTLQPLALAALIWLVFPVPTSGALFMLTLCCLWFGLSGAVRELIVDRVLHRRERAVGVGWGPYLGSKLAVLGLLHTVQCAVFTGIVAWLLGLGDYGFSLPALVGAQALTGLAGLGLGLLVSASMDSSEAAVGSLPLVLIPNICFSSVLVPLRDMGEVAHALSWLSVQRYAFDLCLKTGTHLGAASRIPGQWERVPVSGPLYELGLKPAAAVDMGLSPALLAAVLAAVAVGAVGACWAVLRRG